MNNIKNLSEVCQAPDGYKLMPMFVDDEVPAIYAMPIDGLHPVKWYNLDTGVWKNVVYTQDDFRRSKEA